MRFRLRASRLLTKAAQLRPNALLRAASSPRKKVLTVILRCWRGA